MELGAVQVVAELVNRIFDFEKYEEFPLALMVDWTCMMNTFIEFFCEFFDVNLVIDFGSTLVYVNCLCLCNGVGNI